MGEAGTCQLTEAEGFVQVIHLEMQYVSPVVIAVALPDADADARVFGDVDVLVAPGGLHRTAAVLVAAFGGTRAEPEVRPGFDDRFGREAMVRVRNIEVDLLHGSQPAKAKRQIGDLQERHQRPSFREKAATDGHG